MALGASAVANEFFGGKITNVRYCLQSKAGNDFILSHLLGRFKLSTNYSFSNVNKKLSGLFCPLRFFTIFVDMRIDSYIESLLYNYNCVVVPGFGAFLAHGKICSTRYQHQCLASSH